MILVWQKTATENEFLEKRRVFARLNSLPSQPGNSGLLNQFGRPINNAPDGANPNAQDSNLNAVAANTEAPEASSDAYATTAAGFPQEPEAAISGHTSKATGAVLKLSNQWFRSLHAGSILPRGTQEAVARTIDQVNGEAAKFGENLLRGTQEMIGFVGEKALGELQRLTLRAEEAKKVAADIAGELDKVAKRKLAIESLASQVPAWRPLLKAKALYAEVREPVANTLGTIFRVGQQEGLLQKMQATSERVAEDAEAKIADIESRFADKLETDSARRQAVFDVLGLENNATNNKAVDLIAANNRGLDDYHLKNLAKKHGEVAAFYQQFKNLAPANKNAVLLLLKAMRSSVFGEATAADLRLAQAEIAERAKAQEAKERAEKAQKTLRAFLEKSHREKSLKKGASLELVFKGREAYSGTWEIVSGDQKFPLTLKKTGKTISIAHKDGKFHIVSADTNLLSDLKSVAFKTATQQSSQQAT